MDVRRSALCGIVTVATVACATAHSSKHVEDATAADDLALQVDNHNWSDVVIYVLHDGVRSRFIQVTATRSAAQAIPAAMIPSTGLIQFRVHRIGGHDDTVSLFGVNLDANELTRDDYLSPRISVRTGNIISLTLESNLARSTIGVW
jgi:hypothetical protein